jgi:hypothetical protein
MRCNAQKLYTNPEVTPGLHPQESDTHNAVVPETLIRKRDETKI